MNEVLHQMTQSRQSPNKKRTVLALVQHSYSVEGRARATMS